MKTILSKYTLGKADVFPVFTVSKAFQCSSNALSRIFIPEFIFRQFKICSGWSFGKQMPAKYKGDYPYLKEVDSLALSNVQLQLQQAMKNYFSRKHGKFSRFQSAKHSRKSYTTNNQKGTIVVFDTAIKFPKVGKSKAVIHRQATCDWKVKSATISQDSDGKYYASVL